MKSLSKTLLVILSILNFSNISAQYSINAIGGSVTNMTGGSTSYSIGQIFIKSFINSDNIIIEGVQQTYNNITRTEDIENQKFTVSPNPFFDFLRFEVNTENSVQIEYFLYNFLGNLVKQGIINTNETYVSMENLFSGPYLLKLLDNKGICLINEVLIKF